MATGDWQRLGFPTWRMRLESGVDHLRDITNGRRSYAGKLLQPGMLITGASLLLLTGSAIWRGFLMCALGAMHGEKGPKSKTPLSHSGLTAAPEVLAVEAR
jgi:hypothetical protein